MSVEWINGGAEAKMTVGNGNVIHYVRHEGIYFHVDTPIEVIRHLLAAKRNKTKVHLHLGDSETGKDWLEENDVEGYISNSMGPLKVPLLLERARSDGGGALLDHCIVKIRTLGAKGKVLWQHPKYHTGEITVHDVDPNEAASDGKTMGDLGLILEVQVDGATQARFHSKEELDDYLLLIVGPGNNGCAMCNSR